MTKFAEISGTETLAAAVDFIRNVYKERHGVERHDVSASILSSPRYRLFGFFDGDALIATAGVRTESESGERELVLGAVRRDRRGQGLLGQLLREITGVIDDGRIYALCPLADPATSLAVARLGLRYEGTLIDHKSYSRRNFSFLVWGGSIRNGQVLRQAFAPEAPRDPRSVLLRDTLTFLSSDNVEGVVVALQAGLCPVGFVRAGVAAEEVLILAQAAPEAFGGNRG